MILNCDQGSEAWKAARCGSLGASQVADAIAKTKTGYGASRANVMAQLICERFTDQPTDTFTNAAMQWGTATEPQARDAYSFFADVDVVQVGLATHPRLERTHASPDGLVGEDGMLEIKCPNTATHIDYLLSGTVPAKYVTQMNWQLACFPDRQWVDFMSFDPRMPAHLQRFIRRHHRDDAVIGALEAEVEAFLRELAEKVIRLEELGL